MATIRCSVDTCHYWSQDNYCSAEEIWVKHGIGSKGAFRMEIGAIPNNNKAKKSDKAETSSQTFCETFKPKS